MVEPLYDTRIYININSLPRNRDVDILVFHPYEIRGVLFVFVAPRNFAPFSFQSQEEFTLRNVLPSGHRTGRDIGQKLASKDLLDELLRRGVVASVMANFQKRSLCQQRPPTGSFNAADQASPTVHLRGTASTCAQLAA